MKNSKNTYLILTGITAMTAFSLTSDSFATDEEANNSIINQNKVQDKLSRKFILPSDEDIERMSEEELLEEIKNYDSDIIDMIENMNIVNGQIEMLENQIKLIDKQKKSYLEKDNELKKESKNKSFEINKIKALLNLPSLYLTKDTETNILNIFNKIEEDKAKNEKIETNIDYLDISGEYKENYLEEIGYLKLYLDKESNKVSETKSKVNLRIEELNRRETQNSNPYSSQGTNVDIPNNIDISDLVRNIIDITSQQIGIPYLWGGTTPNGFDCSGLLYYSFGKAGVSIPRTARDQQKICQKISYNELKPGDLVFWNKPATHVALYIGEGKIIESPRTGLKVRSRYIKTTEKGINFGRILE